MSPLFTPEDYEERHEKRTVFLSHLFSSPGRDLLPRVPNGSPEPAGRSSNTLIRRPLSRYGHRHKLDLRQDELAQFDRDSSYLKNLEQMIRQSVSEGLDQPVRTRLNEVLRFRADCGIVDGPPNFIFQLRSLVFGPKRDVEDETLSRSALCIRYADARKNFQPLNMNGIVHLSQVSACL